VLSAKSSGFGIGFVLHNCWVEGRNSNSKRGDKDWFWGEKCSKLAKK